MSRKWGTERVDPLFVHNPKAVLTGEEINVDFAPYVAKRKWYQFW